MIDIGEVGIREWRKLASQLNREFHRVFECLRDLSRIAGRVAARFGRLADPDTCPRLATLLANPAVGPWRVLLIEAWLTGFRQGDLRSSTC